MASDDVGVITTFLNQNAFNFRPLSYGCLELNGTVVKIGCTKSGMLWQLINYDLRLVHVLKWP